MMIQERLKSVHSCGVCTGNMEEALLSGELFDPSSSSVIKSTKSVPGFKCSSCGVEEFKDFKQSLIIDRDLLNKLPKNSPLRESLRQRIEVVARLTEQKS